MGINGLLQFLKPIQKDRHISSYSGQRVAIDSYCWLHKSLYTCAVELAKGIPTDRWILFCLRRIELLLSYNITVVAVFDGAMLPVKKSTEVERENSRLEARRKADELLKKGQHDLAYRKFAESIDVTPELAFSLYKVLREKYNIECIVSPYEADAQLAYLSRTNYVDVVITEDSDLLAFGAKRVFYKMDQSGNGSEIASEDMKVSRELKMYDWDDKMFLTACILSGCDYLPSIKGIGIKTAYKLISEYRTYRKVVDCLRIDTKYDVPPTYLDDFERAYITFRFQMIFCPTKQKLLMLNGSDLEELRSQLKAESSEMKIPNDLENLIDMNLLQKMLTFKDLNFLGPVIPEQTAKDIAHGIIDPISLKPYLSRAISVGKKSTDSTEGGLDSTPKLQHKPRSMELGSMLEKVSGEKHFKISKPAKNVSFPPKKVQSQLSISNFFSINGQRSNVQLSQTSKVNSSLGDQFMQDFVANNENSNSSSLLFRDSKGIRAPYRPPKTMMKSFSLDVECVASRESSNKALICSAKENIPEVSRDPKDNFTSDAFGSPLGFLKGVDKKRRYISRHDLLEDVEKENDSNASPCLKKAKTAVDSRLSKSKTMDNIVIELGNYSKKISDLGVFAFKRQPNNIKARLEEGLTMKDLNSSIQDGFGKRAELVPVEESKEVQVASHKNVFLAFSEQRTQEETQDKSLTAKRLNRQFSSGSETAKVDLSQRFRELVEMNIEFEYEEHNLFEVDKKLQRLELLFDYKGPVFDFKQVLASSV